MRSVSRPDILHNSALTTGLTQVVGLEISPTLRSTITRSVKFNIGKITASMPAISQFFGKSKIFKNETYSSLSSGVFSKHSPNKASRATKESKHL